MNKEDKKAEVDELREDIQLVLDEWKENQQPYLLAETSNVIAKVEGALKEARGCCNIGCDKDAEFEIYDSNEVSACQSPTDACEEHVGNLLGSIPPTEPIGPWTVVPIR